MTPSYPSLTFPNHYTLVTGLRPGPPRHRPQHDARRRARRLQAVGSRGRRRCALVGRRTDLDRRAEGRAAHGDVVLARQRGADTGVRPTRWKPFDEAYPLRRTRRRRRRLARETAATRPRIGDAVFRDARSRPATTYGPDSPQALAAVREADAAIGRLLDGPGRARPARSRRSDRRVRPRHGDGAARPRRSRSKTWCREEEAAVVTIGQSIGIAPRAGHEAAVGARRLLGAHAQYDCWRKRELPARWHYGAHPRVPPIVCQMHEGWDALPRETIAKRPPARPRFARLRSGAAVDARDLFLARGPAFRRGVVMRAVRQRRRVSAAGATARHRAGTERWRCGDVAAGIGGGCAVAVRWLQCEKPALIPASLREGERDCLSPSHPTANHAEHGLHGHVRIRRVARRRRC